MSAFNQSRVRRMNEVCPICGNHFHSAQCEHSVADVERHLTPTSPKFSIVKMGRKIDPTRLTTLPVPISVMHVFNPAMAAISAADEIWGVPETDDYIAMMEALTAEIDVRLQNAKQLKARGL